MTGRIGSVLRSSSPAALPGTIAVGVWSLWAANSGGFFPSSWASLGALLAAVLLLSVLLASPRPRGRAEWTMLAALGLFVVWNYLSLLWADSRGDAFGGAGKALVYATCFVLFAAFPWTTLARETMLGLLVVGIAALAGLELVRLGAVGTPIDQFDPDGRLIGPLDYTNGSAALWTLGYLPAVFLGSARSTSAAARTALLGAAPVLLALAFLGQSRGWLLVLAPTLVVALLLARNRLRLMLAVAITAAPLLWLSGPALDLGERARALDETGLGAGRVAAAIALSALAVGAAAAAWTVLDSRVVLSAGARRRAAVAVGVAIAIGFAGAVGLASARIDDPGAWARARWEEFKGQTYPELGDGSRFSGALGSHRYEQWTIAWHEFTAHPLTGIGADNFLVPYLLNRTDPGKTSKYPHSIPLRLLSQLGSVGTALFLVAAAIAVGLGISRRRRLDERGATAVAACLAAFAYWALHGSVDWFWEIPALAAPAFGLLGLAAAQTIDSEPGDARASRPRTRILVRRSTLAAAGVGACVALVPLWLSHAFQRSGVAVWRTDAAAAYSRLETAADMNPFAVEPLLFEGSIALRKGDLARAEAAFQDALQREPKNWYALAELGFVAGADGRLDTATAYLERARDLNPLDEVVLLALDRIEKGEPIDPAQLNNYYATGVSPSATEGNLGPVVEPAGGLQESAGTLQNPARSL